MMKISFGFFFIFSVLLLSSLSPISASKIHDMYHNHHGGDSSTVTIISRKLMEKQGLSNVILEDYHPIDPSPSSKASVRPGPIEHGAPMIPYIPKPAPPGPAPGGSL